MRHLLADGDQHACPSARRSSSPSTTTRASPSPRSARCSASPRAACARSTPRPCCSCGPGSRPATASRLIRPPLPHPLHSLPLRLTFAMGEAACSERGARLIVLRRPARSPRRALLTCAPRDDAAVDLGLPATGRRADHRPLPPAAREVGGGQSRHRLRHRARHATCTAAEQASSSSRARSAARCTSSSVTPTACARATRSSHRSRSSRASRSRAARSSARRATRCTSACARATPTSIPSSCCAAPAFSVHLVPAEGETEAQRRFGEMVARCVRRRLVLRTAVGVARCRRGCDRLWTRPRSCVSPSTTRARMSVPVHLAAGDATVAVVSHAGALHRAGDVPTAIAAGRSAITRGPRRRVRLLERHRRGRSTSSTSLASACPPIDVMRFSYRRRQDRRRRPGTPFASRRHHHLRPRADSHGDLEAVASRLG